MISSTFDSTKKDLVELLKAAADAETQLPDFQRGWVWDDDHIIDLLASVSRSFPIGTIMLLETGGDAAFQVRPVEGVTPPSGTVPKQLVLDGQQRLTSLYQALLSGAPVVTKDARSAVLERWYYIDISKALDTAVDRAEVIFSIPKDRRVMTNFGKDIEKDYSTPDLEYTAGVFPLGQVFDHWQWAQGYRKFHDHDAEHSKIFDEFEKEVIQRFTHYELPVITLNNRTTKEAVCLVFEKVNTGGVALSVFELLTAMFAAEAKDGFQLRADWEARRARLLKIDRVLGEVSSTDFMQAISLLVSWNRRAAYLSSGGDPDRAPAVTCRRRDLLNLRLADYQTWAPQLEAAFARVARFLHRQSIFETKFLPYSTQLVPLVALFTTLGNKAEDPTAWDRLVRWYWCGVFGELYGSTTETRFARDLSEILVWIEGGTEPRTVVEANFSPQRLLTLRTRRSAAYRGIYVLLLRHGAKDFRTGEESTVQTYFDEAIDIHHIFPQSWCRNQTPPIPPERFDTIVNKTPLTARTNRIIQGDAPSTYLDRLTKLHGVTPSTLDTNVTTHLADPAILRSNDFDAFFAVRERALLQEISALMGKPLQETLGDEFTSDEEPDLLAAG